jgi:hypothetical protein
MISTRAAGGAGRMTTGLGLTTQPDRMYINNPVVMNVIDFLFIFITFAVLNDTSVVCKLIGCE